MSETTLLRQNAIRNNATVGATTPGPVKTGELPHVQVKPVPSAPPVQTSQQQKHVQILAPNSKGAVTSGDLPMVQIKMGKNGPEQDTGQDSPVVVRDNKQPTLAAGNLPAVQVKTDGASPQVKTMPNVQGAPPRIPTAAPALSAPRVVQGVVTRVSAPVASVELPELPEFSTEEMMLCQFALNKHVSVLSESGEAETEAVQLAKTVIEKIDQVLVASAVRAEAAANAAAAAATAAAEPATGADTAAQPAPRTTGYVAPRAGTGGYYSPAALVPQTTQARQTPQAVVPTAPRTGGYVAQQPSVRRTQLNSGLAPRGVKRAQAGKLPTAIIKMEGQRAVVQNQAEIDAAKAALEAAQEAQAADVVQDSSQG